MLEPYQFPAEDQIFTRPTITLISPNAVPQWWMALWIATILMLGTVAAIAFIPSLNGLSRAEAHFQADLRR